MDRFFPTLAELGRGTQLGAWIGMLCRDVLGDGEGAGGGEPGDEKGGPWHARTGRRAEDNLHVGARAVEDCGDPEKERINPELRGFGVGGCAGEHVEDEAKAARDLACSGEVGEEESVRDPGGDQEDGGFVVDDVREADGDDPEAEVETGEAEGAFRSEEGEG